MNFLSFSELKNNEVNTIRYKILHNPNHIYYGNKVCVRSNVFVSKTVLTAAYQQIQPSRFVLTLCYGIFGYELLSKCCVKVQKNTKNLVTLPAKVLRVIKDHFQFWLASNQYPEDKIAIEIGRCNGYFRCAINTAKRKIKNNGNISLDGDEDSEVEM